MESLISQIKGLHDVRPWSRSAGKSVCQGRSQESIATHIGPCHPVKQSIRKSNNVGLDEGRSMLLASNTPKKVVLEVGAATFQALSKVELSMERQQSETSTGHGGENRVKLGEGDLPS